MLTTERMQRIMVDIDLGKEPSPRDDEERLFAKEVAEEIAQIKASGNSVEIPGEWNVDTDEEDGEDGDDPPQPVSPKGMVQFSEFDESKHLRSPKGTKGGGQFTSGGSSTQSKKNGKSGSKATNSKPRNVITETDHNAAEVIVSQGIVPDFKRDPGEVTTFQPGRGIERQGLYVADEKSFSRGSFGNVQILIDSPAGTITLPVEQTQLGVDNVETALGNENGAVISTRVDPSNITGVRVFRGGTKWDTLTPEEYLKERGVTNIPALPSVAEFEAAVKENADALFLSESKVQAAVSDYQRQTLAEKHENAKMFDEEFGSFGLSGSQFAEFDESKVKREGKGASGGGRFAKKAGGDTADTSGDKVQKSETSGVLKWEGISGDSLERSLDTLDGDEIMLIFDTAGIRSTDRLAGEIVAARPDLKESVDAAMLEQINELQSFITSKPEFKKQFGESKVVNDDGEPLMVFHGTDAKPFDEFDLNEAQQTLLGKGFYFTESYSESGFYGNRTAPAYLAINNPWGNEVVLSSEARDGLRKAYKEVTNQDISERPRRFGEKGRGTGDEKNDFNAKQIAASAAALDDPTSTGGDIRKGIEFVVGQDVWVEIMKKSGFDGIRIRNKPKDGEPTNWWIALDPKQVISAKPEGVTQFSDD